MLFRYKYTIFHCLISEIKKTRYPSTNNIYLTMKRGKSYYGGKGYYIARFPPGEKLLYSQFSGGKGYYGGKATIQNREHANNIDDFTMQRRQ